MAAAGCAGCARAAIADAALAGAGGRAPDLQPGVEEPPLGVFEVLADDEADIFPAAAV